MHCSCFSTFGQRFLLQHPKVAQDISKGQDALGVAQKHKVLVVSRLTFWKRAYKKILREGSG